MSDRGMHVGHACAPPHACRVYGNQGGVCKVICRTVAAGRRVPHHCWPHRSLVHSRQRSAGHESQAAQEEPDEYMQAEADMLLRVICQVMHVAQNPMIHCC